MVRQLLGLLPANVQHFLKRAVYRYKIGLDKFHTPEPEFERLKEWLGEGAWAIDIGANVGHYTLRMSHLVGHTGRVIAFEPVPDTFAMLVANMAYSRYENITLINAAASNQFNSLSMSIPESASGLKNYYQAAIEDTTDGVGLSVLGFSVNQLSITHPISLIKIDAEGHEPVVLLGLVDIIKRDSPVLIIETVTDNMRALLLELGYRSESDPKSPNTVFWAEKIVKKMVKNESLPETVF